MPFQLITSKRLKDPEDMGDVFNNFFIVVTENLNLHDVGQEIYYFQKNFFLDISQGLKLFQPLRGKMHNKFLQIRKLVGLWRNNKYKILKTCMSKINQALRYVGSDSLNTFILPDHLKSPY